MTETSAMNNNNDSNINNSVNNGYLKSASKYLTITPTHNSIESVSARPRVIQWDPHMGTDQSTISVVLEQAVSDTNEEVLPMKLVFGQLVVETNQQQQRAPTASPMSSSNSGNLMWITLVARVPKFSDTHVESTGDTDQQVPLSICVYDSNNKDTATDHWNFGVFTYKKGAAEAKQDYQSNFNRKRNAPDTELSPYSSSVKKANTSAALEDEQLFSQLLAPFEDSPKNTNNTSTPVENRPQPLLAPQPSNPTSILSQMSSRQQNPYQHSTQTAGGYYGFNEYGHQQQPHQPLLNIQPNPNSGNGDAAYASVQGSFGGMSYHAYQNNSLGGGYPMPITSTSGGGTSMYSTYDSMPHQSLMHMNKQQESQQQLMMNNTNSSNHPFKGVLSKANLKITGDLMEMTYNWTQDEWNNGRRLVEFWRRQGGENATGNAETEDETISEVECGFKPIDQEEYQQQRIRENLAAQKDPSLKRKPGPLVVSCIYWQERNDYFITSVDCIYLLEGLIGVQFTVEEKNRIRRNLEGFRPLTVSKCKPECADFFKLIMSFPHPKPRNIEKDVKVFPWKTLPNALKKIIRKYTPSYSSTAVVNLNNT